MRHYEIVLLIHPELEDKLRQSVRVAGGASWISFSGHAPAGAHARRPPRSRAAAARNGSTVRP